jgi:hypothetical protein
MGTPGGRLSAGGETRIDGRSHGIDIRKSA